MKKFIASIKKTFESMSETSKQMKQYLAENPVPTV